MMACICARTMYSCRGACKERVALYICMYACRAAYTWRAFYLELKYPRERCTRAAMHIMVACRYITGVTGVFHRHIQSTSSRRGTPIYHAR